MHVPPGVLFLRVIDERVDVALHRPIAAGRIGIQPTARVHRSVRGLLDRLHGAISGRVDDDRPLAADPRHDRRGIFVVMAPAGLTLLATTTRSTPQRLGATLLGSALLAGSVIEVIRFHRACQPAIDFVGHGRIPQPPAPAIARTAMDPQLPGNASRRTRQTQQEGGQNPVRQRSLALVEQCIGQIIEGALAAVTPVAFAAGAVVIPPPRIDVLALAPGTLEGPIFPSQRMDVGMTLVDVEEFVDV